ncbi:Exonuclease 1, partial [Paramuricea clavata]
SYQRNHNNADAWVKNISHKQLTDQQKQVLAKGLNYNAADAKKLDFIADLESALKQAVFPNIQQPHTTTEGCWGDPFDGLRWLGIASERKGKCSSTKLCLCQRVKYVVSPYESDAQIAFLLKNGYADVAVTEDSDLLVYGCEKLFGLNTTNTEFVHGSIAAGCDYLSNVRGVGIHRAFSFVKSGKLFEELKKKHSPANYEDLFQMALAVFQHQSVFNSTLLTVQPLNPWTEDPGDEVKYFCGLYPF